MGKSDKLTKYVGQIESIFGMDIAYKNASLTNLNSTLVNIVNLNANNATFDNLYATSIHGNFVDDFENISGTKLHYDNAVIDHQLKLTNGNESTPSIVFDNDSNGIFYDTSKENLNFKVKNKNNYISEKVTSLDTILKTRSIRQSVLTITDQVYNITQNDIENYGIIFFDGLYAPGSIIQVYLPKFTDLNYIGTRIVIINGKARDSVSLQVNRQPGDYFNGSNNTIMTFNNKYVLEVFLAKIDNPNPTTYTNYYFSY